MPIAEGMKSRAMYFRKREPEGIIHSRRTTLNSRQRKRSISPMMLPGKTKGSSEAICFPINRQA